MKVLMKWGVVRDLPSDVAQANIATGLAEKYEEKPKPKPNMVFIAAPGPLEGDFQHPPAIHHKCSTCGMRGHTTGFNGNSHEARISHCGISDKAPQHVADRYLELFKQWRSKSKRRDGKPITAEDMIPPVSAAFDANSRTNLTPAALAAYRPKPVISR